jgi:hypothetical protein
MQQHDDKLRATVAVAASIDRRNNITVMLEPTFHLAILKGG